MMHPSLVAPILRVRECEKALVLEPKFLINKPKAYDIFWTIYWGFAFVLILVYILLM